MQSVCVSALSLLQETLSRKACAVLPSDMVLIAHWGSAPSAAVSQRIPLALAMLLLSPVNRERAAAQGAGVGVLKALVAAARAANKFKQMHAALAVRPPTLNPQFSTPSPHPIKFEQMIPELACPPLFHPKLGKRELFLASQ